MHQLLLSKAWKTSTLAIIAVMSIMLWARCPIHQFFLSDVSFFEHSLIWLLTVFIQHLLNSSPDHQRSRLPKAEMPTFRVKSQASLSLTSNGRDLWVRFMCTLLIQLIMIKNRIRMDQSWIPSKSRNFSSEESAKRRKRSLFMPSN